MKLRSQVKNHQCYKYDILMLFLNFIIIGYLSHALFTQPMQFVSGNWTDLHQSLFQATLVFAYLTFFIKNNHYRSLWISVTLGLILQHLSVFDEIIHPFFINSGFYDLIRVSSFAGNPQYSKLVLFFPALILQVINQIKQKKDRIRVFLVFIYILITLFIATLNHFIFPSGIMKDLIKNRVEQLSKIELYDKLSFRSFCIQMNARCRVLDQNGIQILNDPSFNFDEEQFKLMNAYTNQLDAQKNITSIETNYLHAIYIVKAKADNSYYEVFDHDYVRTLWTSTLGHFSRNSFLITWLWQIFLTCILFIHLKPRLNDE